MQDWEARLRQQLLHEKVLDWLIEHATIEVVDAEGNPTRPAGTPRSGGTAGRGGESEEGHSKPSD